MELLNLELWRFTKSVSGAQLEDGDNSIFQNRRHMFTQSSMSSFGFHQNFLIAKLFSVVFL